MLTAKLTAKLAKNHWFSLSHPFIVSVAVLPTDAGTGSVHHRDHMMTQFRLSILAWLATLETINKLPEAEVDVNIHELTSLRLLGD